MAKTYTQYLQESRHGGNLSVYEQMNKEEIVHIYNGVLLSHKKKLNFAICDNTDGPGCITVGEISQTETNTI